ncbi:MAG TPA: hypothetical protein PKA06_12005, partial [Gemmatales bacterium]|nr:hypothetical protein [Gemmatales bacterium]
SQWSCAEKYSNVPKSVTVQRIHGDFHLAQVLLHREKWFITDFEGEPLRPLAERRARDLPCRDVAGMLRSFGYLDAVCKRKKLAFPLKIAQESFLKGYSEKLSPHQAEELGRLLPYYLLEKALYEIEYEIRSRPAWVNIPLRAASELLEQFKSNH